MNKVKNAMNVNVVTITADITVDEAIRLLIEHHISGMPVVDQDDRLVGIVTEFQLLETLYAPEIKAMQVRDVMTKDVLTVTPDTTLLDATSLMVAHRVRRLPVIEEGKIIGIVSRRDLLRYTLNGADKFDEFLDEIKATACSCG